MRTLPTIIGATSDHEVGITKTDHHLNKWPIYKQYLYSHSMNGGISVALYFPDCKVHGACMESTRDRQDPGIPILVTWNLLSGDRLQAGQSLSGVPDFFDRNKILSGYDLSHYQVPHCIRVFFYFVWFVFIHHNFQFYFKLCTYCNILDIYLS